MPPVFPTTDLDRPEKLLGLLGSFWAETFTGVDLVMALQHARGQLNAQTDSDFQGLLAAMARETVRPFRKAIWFPVKLLESELQEAGLPVYGDERDFTFATAAQIAFGLPAAPADRAYAWAAPDGLAVPGVLLNRLTDASLTLVSGLDFLLHTDPFGVKRLVFRDNPFANTLVSIRPLLDEQGTTIDREAMLWLYGGEFDRDDVYHQFGYVVTGKARSSTTYRDFVNALYDGLCRGGCASDIGRMFAAAADTPLAKGTETVEAVFTDAYFLWVITDQNAYRCGGGATALVEVGDDLTVGLPVCDAVRFYEFGNGEIPDGLEALAVGPGLLANGYQGDLVFRNEETDLVVETDDLGFTKVSFDIGGLGEDVEQFWDAVHANGLAAGQTLAHLLDQRPEDARDTEPTAAALPATVNPLEFLIANVLRANAFLCRVKTSSFGPDAVGLTRASHGLRTILPPQTLCVTLATLAGGEEAVILDGDDDESWASFSGGEPVNDDYDAPTFATVSSRGWQV